MADAADMAYRSPEVANAYGPAVRADRLLADDPLQRQRLLDTTAIQVGRERATRWMPFERTTGQTIEGGKISSE